MIVTLGTYSLFRGLAEGLARGNDTYPPLPDRFQFLGQGYLFAFLPAQLLIFPVAAAAVWLLLHRTIIGRAWYAIGFSAEAARYAGIPVEWRLMLAYVLSGGAAGLAGVIYVSHLGQVKADAGTGYELMAITAVVLGGTSIFGGRGGVHGTLLGLFAIAVLQRGLRMADQPAELGGILTGVLLLAAVGARSPRNSTCASTCAPRGRKTMKKMSFVRVAVALLLTLAGCNQGKKQMTIAMMPKSKGNAYFESCRKGAVEAAQELNVKLIWDGPAEPDPVKQNEVVDTWITRGVDAIAAAVENKQGMASVLRKARVRGITVVTWDADSEIDVRDYFVNQATPQGIGEAFVDNAARVMGEEGEFAVITASMTAGNMIEWHKQIETRTAKYPKMKQVALQPCDDQQQKAFNEADTILNKYPNVKVILAICSPAVPGAAEAVRALRSHRRQGDRPRSARATTRNTSTTASRIA